MTIANYCPEISPLKSKKEKETENEKQILRWLKKKYSPMSGATCTLKSCL